MSMSDPIADLLTRTNGFKSHGVGTFLQSEGRHRPSAER